MTEVIGWAVLILIVGSVALHTISPKLSGRLWGAFFDAIPEADPHVDNPRARRMSELRREGKAAYQQGGYSAYLLSAYWREYRRPMTILGAGGACERCDSSRGLQVHHKTYRGVPSFERDEDLECLCAECHSKHHNPSLWFEGRKDL